MTLRRAAPFTAVLLLAAACSSSAPPVPPVKHVAPHLAFTGAVTGTGTVLVEPEPTGGAANAQPDSFTTQCLFAAAGSTGAWSAQFAVDTPGNEWQVTLTGPGFGDPKPGRYGLAGPAAGSAADGDLELDVESAKPIAAYLESAGADSYAYYMPAAGGYATVDAGLTSGTVHATLTPTVPSNLTFTINGTWSCH